MFLPRAILLLLAIGTLSSSAGTQLRQVDLAKLRDPATSDAEARRLLSADDEGIKYQYIITDLRLHPQRIDDKDLTLVLLAYDLDFSSRTWFDGYKVENPGELFPPARPAAAKAGGFDPPRLGRLESCQVIPVDAAGKEIKLPDSSTYLSEGYVFDFNRDGILDVADTGNYGVGKGADGKKRSTKVFEVTPVGATEPIFRAVYDWDLFPKKPWTFDCYDEEGDGFVEIAFGPPGEHRVVFRWDEETEQYESSGPIDPQVIVLSNRETKNELSRAFARHDELLAAAQKETAESGSDDSPPSGKPYEFVSLKEADDAGVFAFFNGRAPADPFRDSQDAASDPPASHLPPGFWNLPPKQAALALAETNRTAAHRGTFQLAIDDRGNIAPPASGWLTYDYNSSGCYTLVTHQFAFRFGVERPFLLHVARSGNGVVGANPLVDRPGYAVRIVPMSEPESRFLIDTIFWLDRIRSKGDNESSGGVSSTADGFATLSLHEDGKEPRKIGAGTIWSTAALSDRWTDDYEPATCLNLTGFLLDTAWLQHLGDRWQPAAALKFRNLGTPVEDRLKPRLDASARELLISNCLTVLSIHERDPVPLSLLVEVIECAGDEGLAELLEPIRAIARTLPPVDAEDEEYEQLRRRFARDHFGTPLHDSKEEEPEAWKRYQELRTKRANQPGPVLRETITRALRQLESLDRPELLKAWALGGEAGDGWALQQLERKHPDSHAEILVEQFAEADESGRTRVFETLAAANPKAALRLSETLSAKEQRHLLLEIAELARNEEPPRLAKLAPDLFTIIDKPAAGKPWRVATALTLLDSIELSVPDQARLDRALLAEFDAPPGDGPLPSSNIPTVIEILLKRPDRDRYWDLFVKAGSSTRSFQVFEPALAALIELSEERPADRASALEAICRHRLREGDGFMNKLFFTILRHDLRGLRDELQALASSGPGVNDGEGSNSAGGGFSDPQDYRYHAAREVLALWSEPDAPTRARMWIALALNRPYEFHGYRGGSPDHEALRALAINELKALPADQRAATLSAMLKCLPPGTTIPERTRAWLEEPSR